MSKEKVHSVFSINSETGQPYIEVKQVTNLIQYHVQRKMPWLLLKNSMEDIIQMYMEKICTSTYDVTKSAPKTWVIRILQTRGLQLHQYDNAKGRYLAGIDDKIGYEGEGAGEREMFHSERMPDNITPLDIVLAKEKVREFDKECLEKYARKEYIWNAPADYKGFRDTEVVPIVTKSKVCVDCKLRKTKEGHFTRNVNTTDGYQTACMPCTAKRRKKYESKRKKQSLKKRLDV